LYSNFEKHHKVYQFQYSVASINAYISKENFLKCIQKLKNGKACGEDEIINEYIKSTSNQFINIYEKLFNIIFDKGFVPHIWLIATIKPIYKNVF
jgi:hypothetical protein